MYTHTQKLLRREVFTPRGAFTQSQTSLYAEEHFYRKVFTQELSKTDVFTQKLLHRKVFTQGRFYAEKFLRRKVSIRRGAFADRSFYAQELLCREVFLEGLLHTEALTQRSFYTQKLLRAEALTYRAFYTGKLVRREAFLQRSLATHRGSLLRRCKIAMWFADFAVWPSVGAKGCHLRFQNLKYTSVFAVRPLFRAKGLHLQFQNRKFYISFWRSTTISCETVAPDLSTLQFCNSFSTFPFYVVKSHFYISLRRSAFISCERVASQVSKLHTFVRLTGTISAEGSSCQRQIRISPHVCASDTRDLCRGLRPDDFEVGFDHTFVRPTRTISAEGCSSPRQSRVSPTCLCVRRARSAEGQLSMDMAGRAAPAA